MKSPGKETDVPLVGIDERGLSGTYVLGKERHPSDDRFSNEDLQNQQQRYSHNFSDVSYRQQKDEIQRDLAADSLVKHAKKSYKSLPSERTRRGSLQAGLLQGTVDEQRLHNDEGWKGQVTKVRDQRSSSQRPDKWGADSRQDDGWFKSKAKHGARMVGEKSSRTLKQQASSSTTDDHSQTVDARIMSPKISEAFPGAQEVISEKRTFDPGWWVKAHGRDDGWQNGGNKSNKKESTKGKGKKTKTKKSKDGTESKRAVYHVPAPENDILFGIAPCWLALQHNKRVLHQAFVSPSFQSSDRQEVRGILEALGDEVKLDVVHTDVLDELSGGRPHQGVCIETSRLEHYTLSDREEVLSSQVKALLSDHDVGRQDVSPPLWLALDQVKDPMNFGAVLRSSYFFGVDKVITCTENSCPLSPVVSKASSGVMEIYDVYAAMDMLAFLQCMTDAGWQVIGTTSSNASQSRQGDCVPCEEFVITQPTVVVVGNEGIGMRPQVEAKCSKFVTIQPGRELHPGMDSLNVSVATGVLLHSLLKGVIKKT